MRIPWRSRRFRYVRGGVVCSGKAFIYLGTSRHEKGVGLPPSNLRICFLHDHLDRGEGGDQLGACKGSGGNDHEGDQRDDEARFNGREAFVLLDKGIQPI